MPTRIPRGLRAREVYPGETIVLDVEPIFTGEDLGRYGGPMLAATLPTSVANSSRWDPMGPYGFAEMNVTTLFCPNHIINTYTGAIDGAAGSNMGDNDYFPHPPVNRAQWDLLARRLLLEFGVDGNEYYGANPDDRAVYDARRSTWQRQRGTDSTDATPAPAQDDPAIVLEPPQRRQDEPLIDPNGATMGPLGVQRLYEREVLLSPQNVNGPTRNIASSVLGTLFATAYGAVDLTHSWSDQISVPGPVAGAPGYLLHCIHRYDIPEDKTEGFASTYRLGNSDDAGDAGLTAAQQKEVNRALNSLFGGDLERVQAILHYDNGFLGDFTRSILFAGDLDIEEPGAWMVNLFGSSGFWDAIGVAGQSKTYFRPNGIVVAMKKHAGILTPYTLRMPH